ncbi:hypothetical protein N007_16545 [Alicyclobacillus acidoterrestris ATCC 49025]|nr:hypothetical protein N007_16545 [Alicyclobacillus acidoterrestris ATCC 49025]
MSFIGLEHGLHVIDYASNVKIPLKNDKNLVTTVKYHHQEAIPQKSKRRNSAVSGKQNCRLRHLQNL